MSKRPLVIMSSLRARGSRGSLGSAIAGGGGGGTEQDRQTASLASTPTTPNHRGSLSGVSALDFFADPSSAAKRSKVAFTFSLEEVARNLFADSADEHRTGTGYHERYIAWLSSGLRTHSDMIAHLSLISQHADVKAHFWLVRQIITGLAPSGWKSSPQVIDQFLKLGQKFSAGKPQLSLLILKGILPLFKCRYTASEDSVDDLWNTIHTGLGPILAYFDDDMARKVYRYLLREWMQLDLDLSSSESTEVAITFYKNSIRLFANLEKSTKCMKWLMCFLVNCLYPSQRDITIKENAQFYFVDGPKSDSELEVVQSTAEMDDYQKLAMNHFIDRLLAELLSWIISNGQTEEMRDSIWNSIMGSFWKTQHNLTGDPSDSSPLALIILIMCTRWPNIYLLRLYTSLMEQLVPTLKPYAGINDDEPKKVTIENEHRDTIRESVEDDQEINNDSGLEYSSSPSNWYRRPTQERQTSIKYMKPKNRQRLAHWLAAFLVHGAHIPVDMLDHFLVNASRWCAGQVNDCLENSVIDVAKEEILSMVISLIQSIVYVLTWRILELNNRTRTLKAVGRNLSVILISNCLPDPLRSIPQNLTEKFFIVVAPLLGILVKMPVIGADKPRRRFSNGSNITLLNDMIVPFYPLDLISASLAKSHPLSAIHLSSALSELSLTREIFTSRVNTFQSISNASLDSKPSPPSPPSLSSSSSSSSDRSFPGSTINSTEMEDDLHIGNKNADQERKKSLLKMILNSSSA